MRKDVRMRRKGARRWGLGIKKRDSPNKKIKNKKS
jgi:hypothetical protein